MDVIAGIEDRYRSFVVDGEPVATGVVAVGDAWACTNPSLGRGATIGLLHAIGLRDVLRDTDPGEHDKLARRFHDWTAATVEPLYRGTLLSDRHRLAELDADAAGVPYEPDDPRWTFSKATFAASLGDPDIARAYQSLTSMLSTPDDLRARPGLPEKIMKLGAGAPTIRSPAPAAGTYSPPSTAEGDTGHAHPRHRRHRLRRITQRRRPGRSRARGPAARPVRRSGSRRRCDRWA